jgi:hypothetical protein
MAQTFVFSKDGVLLEDNADITATQAIEDEFGGDLLIESGIGLKNSSNELLPVILRQTIEAAPPFFNDPPDYPYGFINFCLSRCIAGNEDGIQTLELEAGEWLEAPDFHLYYLPKVNRYATVKIRYEAILGEQIGTDPLLGIPIYEPTDDKSTLILTYQYDANSLPIAPIELSDLRVYQKDKQLTFNYNFNESNLSLEIYNLMGLKTAHHTLNAGGTFALPEILPAGMYVYSIKSGNKSLIVNKLIVK